VEVLVVLVVVEVVVVVGGLVHFITQEMS
jgi:hypothetical protein